jgi:2-phospho-L-lactate guanylyltransferase
VPVDVAVLIPVKRFTAAKRRLHDTVGTAERSRLAEWMASQVVSAVAEVPTFVACDDPVVREWAEARGARVVWGPDLGLNRAVDDGVDHLISLGARQIIVTHADLPRPGGLLDVPTAGVITLVPDPRRDGTNVMSFPSTNVLHASYGGGSFGRHLRQAVESGAPYEVRIDRDLALDLDVADDLAHPLIHEVLPQWLRTSPASPPD